MWEFDVFASTHDLLQQGITKQWHTRIVLSEEEFTLEEAHLFAAQWGCRGGRMCTEVMWRF